MEFKFVSFMKNRNIQANTIITRGLKVCRQNEAEQAKEKFRL